MHGRAMKRLFARKLKLRPSIVALFVLLTVPVFFTSVAVTYVSNEEIARANAETLIERFRTDAIGSIQGMLNPIKSLVRSAAMVGSQQPDFYSDNRSLKYLFSMLLHSDELVSVSTRRSRSRANCRLPVSNTPIAGSSRRPLPCRSTITSSSTRSITRSADRSKRRPTIRERGSGIGRPSKTAN